MILVDGRRTLNFERDEVALRPGGKIFTITEGKFW